MSGVVTEWVELSLPEVIGEAIGQALDAEDLVDLDFDRDAVRGAVKGLEEEISKEAREEITYFDAILDLMAARLRYRDRVRRRLHSLRLLGLILALPGVLLGLHSLFRLHWPIHYYMFGRNGVRNTILSLVIIVGAALVFMAYEGLVRVAVGLSAAERYVALTRTDVGEARHVLVEKVRSEVARLVRVTVNDLQVGAEQVTGALLATSKAPQLVELNVSESLAVEGLRAVKEFIAGHSTSAIGIAGTRGVGKTTVIRSVSASKQDESIGTYIDAPVYYDAADFVRLVHEKVADSILESKKSSYPELVGRSYRSTFLLRMALSLLMALIGIALIVAASGGMQIPFKSQDVIGGLFLLASLALYVSAFLAMIERSRFRFRAREPQQADPVALARESLDKLRWRSTVGNKASTKLKIFSFLETDDATDLSLAERERTHPERVADFKNFVRAYHAIPESLPLVVAIDELDKIASAEKALELVNGLKDILHMPKTHFVVSVSEDALNSFALRGVPVRDVFDSSFDTVVHLRPLASQDSINLLKGRVVVFPESAALLCHVLSGGLPRDLIRAARRCVELRRDAGHPVPVSLLGRELPRLELLDVVDAALRVRRIEPDKDRAEVDAWLLRLREGLRLDDVPMAKHVLDSLNAGAELCRQLPAGDPTENILCVAAVLCTASEFFAKQRTSQEWSTMLADSKSRYCVELLAEARMAAATFPAQCRRQVVEARELLSLAPI